MRLFAEKAYIGSRVSRRGFTMIEIALSLAVVGFALVAIMGVLPTGMTVQKDNREDILINQEGRYWMQLIKTGARGMEDLTNYVEFIAITNLTKQADTRTFLNQPPSSFLSAADIVTLLSTPKYNSDGTTNKVVARVRPISGPAGDKGSLTNDAIFRYEIQAEVTQSFPLPPGFARDLSPRAIAFNEVLGANLYDVRLVLRWPVIERGSGWFVGNNSKTFRARIAGTFGTGVPVGEVIPNLSPALVADNLTQVLLPNQFQINTNIWNASL